MMYKEIIKRLLWREWRENWLFLLVGCGLPLACGRIAQTYEKIGDYEDILGIVMVLIIMMVLMQIAAKSYVTPGKPAKSRLLPVPAAMEFFSAYIIRAITPLLIGTALGVMMGMNTNIITYKEALGIWIATFGVITLTCYLLIVLMSHVSNSIIIGIISGVVYLISLVINVGNTTHGLNSLVYPWFMVGILVSIIYWEICAHYRRIVIGRVLVVVIMAVAILYPIKQQIGEEAQRLGGYVNDIRVKSSSSYIRDYSIIYSKNLTYRVACDKNNGRKLKCDNIESNEQKQHIFTEFCRPLAVSDDGNRVLLLQKKIFSSKAQLLLWKPQSDEVSKIVDIPVHYLDFGYGIVFNDSKTGRDILVIGTMNSEYYDVWVIDVMQARAKMIVGRYSVGISPNSEFATRFNIVKWEENQVSYFIGRDKYVVAFPSMNITKSELPIARVLR